MAYIKNAGREKVLLSGLLLFAAGVMVISLLYKNNYLLTLVMAIGWLVASKFIFTKRDNCMFLIAALLGAAAEIVAVKFGAWQYVNPTYFGVPLWLPLLWGSSTVFIARLTEMLINPKLKNVKPRKSRFGTMKGVKNKFVREK